MQAELKQGETRGPEGWRLVILGCGTSHGNPQWGCPAQWSADPKDARRRAGAALLGPTGQIVLIDCGPDLVDQCRDPFKKWDGKKYPEDSLNRCDAVLLTHDHADHLHGLNDLRHLTRLMGGRGIPIYAYGRYLSEAQRMFPYAFGLGSGLEAAPQHYRYSLPVLIPKPIAPSQVFSVAGIAVESVMVSHGPAGPVAAWRMWDRVGYCTDCKVIPPRSMERLKGLDLLVITMLQSKAHPTHMNFAETMSMLEYLKPRRAVLTHLGPDVIYSTWQDRLPGFVSIAYDGLTLEV